MTIITEQSLRSFEFWSGAKDNADELTIEQFDELENILEELYPDGMTERHWEIRINEIELQNEQLYNNSHRRKSVEAH